MLTHYGLYFLLLFLPVDLFTHSVSTVTNSDNIIKMGLVKTDCSSMVIYINKNENDQRKVMFILLKLFYMFSK